VLSVASSAFSEGVTRRLALKRRPIEVLGMFGQHLEAHEVSIFVANKSTVHKDVILFKHKLLETVQVKRSTHADKKFGVF
jgi:hypothetical protein